MEQMSQPTKQNYVGRMKESRNFGVSAEYYYVDEKRSAPKVSRGYVLNTVSPVGRCVRFPRSNHINPNATKKPFGVTLTD